MASQPRASAATSTTPPSTPSYANWQEQAYENLNAGGRPVITDADILPVFRDALIAVRKRHWRSLTCIPSGPPNEHDLGTNELWFRNKTSGRPMCAWRYCFHEWKLAERWADKDDDAEDVCQGRGNG